MTPKQLRLFRFIDDYITENGGVAPSFSEMRGHMGLRSKSGVHRMVESLEASGWIWRGHYRSRSIRILKRPGDQAMPKPSDIEPTERMTRAGAAAMTTLIDAGILDRRQLAEGCFLAMARAHDEAPQHKETGE